MNLLRILKKFFKKQVKAEFNRAKIERIKLEEIKNSYPIDSYTYEWSVLGLAMRDVIIAFYESLLGKGS